MSRGFEFQFRRETTCSRQTIAFLLNLFKDELKGMEGDDDFADESLLIHEAVAVTDMIEKCQLQNVPMPSTLSTTTHSLQFKKSIALTPAEKKVLFDIFVSNMEELYTQSGWGWDIAQEQKELFHITSRFLFLLDNTREGTTTPPIIGYVMFRFEWDDEEEPEHPVLFVYQLQIAAAFQHLGIGRYLMSLVEEVAKNRKMWKVMLTCFKENRKALSFYLNKMQYGVDVNSPSRCGYEEETYEIISNKPNLR